MDAQDFAGIVAKYAFLKRQIDLLEREMKPLAEEIRRRHLATSEPSPLSYVHFQRRQGYESVSYDARALDGYALAHPGILSFRKVREVAETVVIRVDPPPDTLTAAYAEFAIVFQTAEIRQQTFDEWMQAIDIYIEKIVAGLSCADLPDMAYRDLFDAGVSPEAAAKLALKIVD